MQTLVEWIVKLVALAAAIVFLYFTLPAVVSYGTMPYIEGYLPRPVPGLPTTAAAFIGWLLRFICAGLVMVAGLLVIYAIAGGLTNNARRRLN